MRTTEVQFVGRRKKGPVRDPMFIYLEFPDLDTVKQFLTRKVNGGFSELDSIATACGLRSNPPGTFLTKLKYEILEVLDEDSLIALLRQGESVPPPQYVPPAAVHGSQ